MNIVQKLLIAYIVYYFFIRKQKEGFISMHDSRENPLYRDI